MSDIGYNGFRSINIAARPEHLHLYPTNEQAAASQTLLMLSGVVTEDGFDKEISRPHSYADKRFRSYFQVLHNTVDFPASAPLPNCLPIAVTL